MTSKDKNSNDKNVASVKVLPKCSFCSRIARFDGKTTMGPWGYMCSGHFKLYGVGLGVGRGQKLELLSTPKIDAEIKKDVGIMTAVTVIRDFGSIVEELDISISENDPEKLQAFLEVLEKHIGHVDPENELTIKDACKLLTITQAEALLEDLKQFIPNE